MVYGLELLAGVRTGEASELRWRHYDPVVRPLGKLLVARSYNSRTGREKNTKTEAVKHVPVHPTLAAMLAEWKLGGWPELMGRAPGPDDLIVPLPRTRPIGAARAPESRTAQPATRGSTGGRPTPGARLAAPAALRHARHVHHARHRRWADPEILENRVTHARQSRSAFDGYNRGQQWERTCAEVAKLRIGRGARREAVSAVVGSDPRKLAAASLSSDDRESN
jgi:hypothetical protein